MEWQEGHRLKNRDYYIEQILGEGGFGITYKAKDVILDIPVVIKTPNRRLQRDNNYTKYVENFTKEARQLAKLSLNPHPHIVRVSSLFQEDNLPCIVMDFVPGESLYNLVYKHGALSEAKALEYIRQIGSALVVCHQQGIIHRDVHPNNILIRSDNEQAVLIDFGIAGTTQTSRNTHSGNQAFAPWEQIAYWENENSKTPQIDIYTLAASFYYLVTGETPTPSLARKYDNRELEPPKQLNPALSERINRGIVKGMEVLAENRPNSMQEWLNLLITPSEPETARKKNYVPQTTRSIPVPPTVPEQNYHRGNGSSVTVTRRNWLKYSGLAIAGVGTAWLGKNIWGNATKQTKESDLPEDSTPSSSDKTNLKLTEYQFDVITVNDRGEEINREVGKAKYFAEELGNGITLEMVEIPGGTFMMGTEKAEIEKLKKKDDAGWFSNESPQHQVIVPSFYMGKFQVTQEQWKAVASLPQIQRELKLDPSEFKGNKLPVEKVSWDDAVEFCARLSKATGKEYRLPSEAEWEYACRAGTTTPFYFGETITTDLANYQGTDWKDEGKVYPGNYANETKGKYRETTTEVGSFPPNGFGLYDMHGNVWEWCGDNYRENYQGAPDDGSAWLDENSSESVIRGGSWFNFPYDCRSAVRLRGSQYFIFHRSGVRCVVSRTP